MYTMGLFSESTQTTDVTWLLWVALGFFAIMVVVGWLASRNQRPDEEQTQAHPNEGHEGQHQ